MDTATTATATQVYRVDITGFSTKTGNRTWGFTIKGVEATDKAHAAEVAIAKAIEQDNAKTRRHNADAAKFGTWTMDEGWQRFEVNKVRRFAADNR